MKPKRSVTQKSSRSNLKKVSTPLSEIHQVNAETQNPNLLKIQANPKNPKKESSMFGENQKKQKSKERKSSRIYTLKGT
jgi:hypothetical protein